MQLLRSAGRPAGPSTPTLTIARGVKSTRLSMTTSTTRTGQTRFWPMAPWLADRALRTSRLPSPQISKPVQATQMRKTSCAQQSFHIAHRCKACPMSEKRFANYPLLLLMQCMNGICRFQNSRGWCCAAYNEVAIDYNAAFTGAIARLVDFYDGMKPFSDCSLDLGWTHPNASLVRMHQCCCHRTLLSPICQMQSRRLDVTVPYCLNALETFCSSSCSFEASCLQPARGAIQMGQSVCGSRAHSGVLQALKPQWPADDCYHSCCSGETASSVPAVPSGRKAGAGTLASAAKEAVKDIVRAAEDGAGKASCRL